MSILTATDYPTIRNIMGVDITQVPDAVFADFAHEPLADAWAQDMVPDWQAIISAGLADATYLKAAVAYYTMYLTASWLQLQLMEREKLGDYEYQRNRQLNWLEVADNYLQMAESMISRISTRLVGITGAVGVSIGGPTSDGTNLLPNVTDRWWW